MDSKHIYLNFNKVFTSKRSEKSLNVRQIASGAGSENGIDFKCWLPAINLCTYLLSRGTD